MSFPTFKSKDEIPEPFRAEYEERDGQWHPKVPDVAKIEETLAKVRSEKKDAEKLAKESSDKAADLQRQLDAKAATGADTDKKVAEMLEKWNKEKDEAVAAVVKEKDTLAGELRTLKLDDQLRAAFLASGGRSERADKALALTKGAFDLVDGQIVHKNEKGDVTTTKVADFYGKTFRTEMPEFYAGTRAAGGGAGGGAGTLPAKGDPSAADRVIANPLAMLKEANETAA